MMPTFIFTKIPASPNASRTNPLELKEYKNVQQGDPAPAFAALTLEGKLVKLADLRGKFVVLDFWTTWCPSCIAELTNIAKLHEKYKHDPRVVVVVSGLR